ncbi:MAG: arsenite methyltransferase [Acidimicrobiales bacterium]
MEAEAIDEAVREHYAAAARTAACCGNESPGIVPNDQVYGAVCYDSEALAGLPSEAVAGSIGCANPVELAQIHPGEVVLDLGSGGGIDVFLSARRVGPTGKAYGLDATDEMLELARANQERAGLDNVEFLKGRIERIPLPESSVDVIISNCVLNLSPDKAAVFAEAFRVLRPGGRLAVADVVADRAAANQQPPDMAAWVDCLAGALTRDAYRAGLEAAGFGEVSIRDSHEVADGFASALISARKPIG